MAADIKVTEYLRLVNRFYEQHCDMDLKNPEVWELINDHHKKFINATEQKYKPLVRRALLGVMEVLDAEVKQ